MSIRNMVLMARHGSHDEIGRVLSGRSEIGLNAAGRAEAKALARMLRDVPLASIHASPRARTMATAAPVARAHGLAVNVAPALDEIDFGRFAGQAFGALDENPDWRRWNAERATFRCPGGETMEKAVRRARAFLLGLPDAGMPVLCVTHCDVIRGLVAEASGYPLDRLWELPCEPGSLTELALEDGVIRLIELNRIQVGLP